ncbi:MAG: dihydroorotase [Methylobacteriaceae bacterium]|jgi:dihydroorotase|nr:dihydroorotase [Methylobacteriaceae bacterium]
MTVTELFTPPAAAEQPVEKLVIRRPDDMHVHLRDGAMLKAVLPATAGQFARGIIMPNLTPPVTTSDMAADYRTRVLKAMPEGAEFTPLMTCYLTDRTDPDDLIRGFEEKIWYAAKLYPAGATTNSAHGVTDIDALSPILETMERLGMPVLIHGEATDPAVDIFDREAYFLENTMVKILERHQGLKVVVEHCTTEQGVALVRSYAPRVAGTITPHHLYLNRTSLFQGGLRPHFYCLPVAKREHHRLALRKAATSGETCFFIGTDTAPHLRTAKESACGSAGVFCALTALQSYVQVFDEENALPRFEAFASENAARFYGLPLNDGTIELIRKPSRPLVSLPVADVDVAVFRGGEEFGWSIGETRV